MHQKTPVTIFVVGTSGSGKTTTIEYLTTHLTGLGLHVAVVKHIHHGGSTLDTQGKDTWRHARAGAEIVVAIAPRELIAFKRTAAENRLESVIKNLHTESIDVLFLEGFSTDATRHSHKIVTARDAGDLKYTLGKTKPPILAITGPVVRSSRGKLGALDLPSQGATLFGVVNSMRRKKSMTN